MGEQKVIERVRSFARQFQMPWLPRDGNGVTEGFSIAEFVQAGEEIPPGVTARANTSMILPPQIADLIGVATPLPGPYRADPQSRDRRPDAIQFAGAGHVLAGPLRFRAGTGGRAVRALQRRTAIRFGAVPAFAASAKDPHRFDTAAARGRSLFTREKCNACHTPPLYTNNRLIPVEGFGPRFGGHQK